MNPILRPKIPPSVRRLLTDIGPKEDHHFKEWTDAEPESVTRDGIKFPPRGAGSHEEFLTPANKQDEQGTADGGGDTRRSTVCGLCKSEPSCYTCPRCNVPYCGLACYRSPDHSACSEEFYKESVLRELKDMGQAEADGRRKMQDILLGLRQRANRKEGGMESVLRELEDSEGDGEEEEEGEGMKERAQVLELLSRLAELQQTGEEKAGEIEGILRRLEEVGGGDGELSGGAGGVDLVDDGTEGGEELALTERLSGMDIDALPEEALWELLTHQEKERFMGLVRGGTIGALVPLWRPWWEAHEEEEEEGGGRALVEVLEEEEEVNKMEGEGLAAEAGSSRGEEEQRGVACAAASCIKTPPARQGAYNKVKKSSKTQDRGKSATKLRKSKGESRKEVDKVKDTSLSSVPPISAKIPKLSSLSSNPSPLVCNGLVNSLFGYTFTLCLFNGDIDSMTVEFCDMVLAVSEALSSGRVFNSPQEALECGEAAILAGGYLDREDPRATARAVEAVAHITTGRSRQDAVGYCLAALSQLSSSLAQARAALPKGGRGEEEEARRKYFMAAKKCEFYQAWASDNARQMRRLAIGLWNEHSKRESERSSLEKDKSVVEEGWKRGERKGNGVLIEELS